MYHIKHNDMDNFLTTSDYLVFITQGALQKILRDNESKLTDAERMAYGYIYEKLSASFNLDVEIQKRDGNRNPALVRWMTVLAIYYIYQSVPDEEIPERVRQNYEDAIAEIQRVASGKDNSTLSPITDQSGEVRVRSRFYYEARRNQRPFGF